MTSNRRHYAVRIHRRIPVVFDLTGRQGRGFITNVSAGGVYIQTSSILKIGSAIKITFEGEGIVLNGRVVRNQQPAPGGLGSTGGMGIEIVEASANYQSFWQSLQSDLSPSDSKYAGDHKLVLSYPSKAALLTDYVENLRHGYVYIKGQPDLPLEQDVLVNFSVSGFDQTLAVKAIVVDRTNPYRSIDEMRESTVELAMMSFDAVAINLLSHYIQTLSSQLSWMPIASQCLPPSSGDLSSRLVPELLAKCYQTKLTSQLCLIRGDIRKTIYLKNGLPIYVASNLIKETLGEFLVRQGKIDKMPTQDSWRSKAAGKASLHGEFLIKQGIIDGNTLYESLITQQKEKLLATFPWFYGNFEFKPIESWPDHIADLPAQPFDILLQGINQYYPPEVIQAWCGFKESDRIRTTGVSLEGMKVSPKIMRILQYAHHEVSIGQVSTELGYTQSAVFSAVFAAALLGWMDIIPT